MIWCVMCEICESSTFNSRLPRSLKSSWVKRVQQWLRWPVYGEDGMVRGESDADVCLLIS